MTRIRRIGRITGQGNAVLATITPCLTRRQRRAVETLAARGRVASPLAASEIFDMIVRLDTGDPCDGLARYYALLDALAVLQPGHRAPSRHDMEGALQGTWEREAQP